MNDPYIVFGPFVIGTSPLSVKKNGVPVKCEHQKHKKWNPRSVKLLISLIEHQKQLVRASEIDELAYYGDRLEARRSNFQKYMSRLTCCLGDELEPYLETVSKVADLERHEGGYKFVGDAYFTNDPESQHSPTAQHRPRTESSTGEDAPAHILTPDRTFVGHSGPVNATAAIDDRYILSGSTDHTIRLWGAQSGECLHIFKGHTDAITDLAVFSHRRRFISSSWDGTLRVWDIDSRRCMTQLKGHTRGVCAVAVASDDKGAVSGAADCTLRVWKLGMGKPLIFRRFQHAVYGVALTSDRRFAIASSSSTVTMLHIDSKKIFKCFEHSADVHGVIMTSDGKHLISCANDGAIHIWDIASVQCIARLCGHEDVVWEALATPDGRHVLSCSADGSARMWNRANGNVVAIFEGHGGSVNGISLMPDTQRIVTGSDDASVRLWRIPSAPSWVFNLSFRNSGLHDCSGRRITVKAKGKVKTLHDLRCCELDGGYIEIGKHPELDSLEFFAIEAVITPDSIDYSRQNILEAQHPAIALFVANEGRLVGSINTAKGWNNVTTERNLIKPGIRTSVGFSRDSTGKMELRINGETVAEKIVGGAIQKVDKHGFRIGAWTDGKTYLFRGKIEDVAIGKLT